ncbi:hypothetical protein L3Q82_006081 [Scortum barcoo]|uniref:Uncharacterized protein n=1 Tax=Scortum barcoo TaxID=214431 RepID=A0ACB8X2A6_9TELE|nr:hypothetical protein L3Q82_006081 [Scortum barcoo]
MTDNVSTTDGLLQLTTYPGQPGKGKVLDVLYILIHVNTHMTNIAYERSAEEQYTCCSPPRRGRQCSSAETCCRLHHLTGSLQEIHTIREEISIGAGEESLAVSLLQQPPLLSIMDLWTKRVAGIIAQVALLLCSSDGTTGEGGTAWSVRIREEDRAESVAIKGETVQLNFNTIQTSDRDSSWVPPSGGFLGTSNLFKTLGLDREQAGEITPLAGGRLEISQEELKNEVCDGALVSNLLPSSFRSSSQLSSSHAPGFAKLNRRDGAGGWSPLTSDRYQWLEVDLGERTKITAVATQGRYGSSDWLSSYLLMFSDTGHNWKQYRQEDSIGTIIMLINEVYSNADSVVQYKLQQPVMARFLRVIPLDWNPNGRIGLRLETYGCPYSSDVVSLDGSSSGLVYRLSPGPKSTSRDVVSLKFKTLRNSGTLLHAEGDGGLSLSLELERGKLQLLLRQDRTSEPRRLASLGSLLDDQHWHHLSVERRSSQLNLTVDKHTERVQIPAEFSHWDIEQLSVGTVQSLVSQKPVVSKRNFHGCLENLLYNNRNLIELVKHKDQQVTVMGNVTFSCAEPVSVAVTFPGPRSFLQLPGATASSSGGVSVGFQFRTWNKAGLLLTFDLPQGGGVVWLYLSEARLRLQIHKAGRALLELTAGSALNDGQWHLLELNSRRGRLSITVDKEEGGSAQASPSFSVTTEGHLFFGGKIGTGCPAEDERQECRNPFNVFQGCMRLLTLDTQSVDLIMVQQKKLGNYSNLQIDMCGIIDSAGGELLTSTGDIVDERWKKYFEDLLNPTDLPSSE